MLCRNDGSGGFDWGGGGPGGGVPIDHFSARWTRNWTFAAGRYVFHLRGDDGIRLWVDNALIIDQWRDQPRTEYTVTRDLAQGGHSLKVEYYENGGEANVALWWDALSSGPPDRPALTSPGDGASTPQTPDVTLQCNAAARATEYKVELWGGPYGTMTPCDWQSGTSCHIGQM